MVGNLAELVGDWEQRGVGCGSWGSFSDDIMCVIGADTASGPSVYVRGGDFANGTAAGVFAIYNLDHPQDFGGYFGFRCVR
jgi:formylglycine-generating enzyme required for sulfatase activity